METLKPEKTATRNVGSTASSGTVIVSSARLAAPLRLSGKFCGPAAAVLLQGIMTLMSPAVTCRILKLQLYNSHCDIGEISKQNLVGFLILASIEHSKVHLIINFFVGLSAAERRTCIYPLSRQTLQLLLCLQSSLVITQL